MRVLKELSENEQMDEWFRVGAWFAEWPVPLRLSKISIRVDPAGVLAIISGVTAEGPVVGFCGANGVSKVWRKLASEAGRAAIKFRPDSFRLDGNR